MYNQRNMMYGDNGRLPQQISTARKPWPATTANMHQMDCMSAQRSVHPSHEYEHHDAPPPSTTSTNDWSTLIPPTTIPSAAYANAVPRIPSHGVDQNMPSHQPTNGMVVVTPFVPHNQSLTAPTYPPTGGGPFSQHGQPSRESVSMYLAACPATQSSKFDARHSETIASNGYSNINEIEPLTSPTTFIRQGTINYGDRRDDRVYRTQNSPAKSSPPVNNNTVVMHCHFCDKFYTGNWAHRNLSRHMDAKHSSSNSTDASHPGEVVLKCTVCERQYRRQDARLKHERECHPELNRPPPVIRKKSNESHSGVFSP